jgi:flavin-dependent dehydrogenase
MTARPAERVDVAVVGGGPAGAAIATYLARAGLDVVALERSPAWRWRAGGVFASPAAVAALRRLGLDAATLRRVGRPIPAMRVETRGGTTFELTYGAEAGGPSAVGFDRSALDPALLELATAAGAVVRRGVAVTAVQPSADGRGTTGELTLAGAHGPSRLRARVIVGADGPRSVVARTMAVHRPVRLPSRVGLSHHLADQRADEEPVAARMRLVRDGYIGIAPVPGGRVNIGIVLGPSWRRRLAECGASAVAQEIVSAIPATADDPSPWRFGAPCEPIAGVAPLGVRATRRAGPGWYLVGDAAGFADPFTGEGLHRALVSAELAARSIGGRLHPSRRRASTPEATAAGYERAMRRRFLGKDIATALVQAFLAHPAWFEYAARRLASRPRQRATLGLVIGDLAPASRSLDPRELVALLRP